LKEAKNALSTLMAAALKDAPQTITKHGKPAVVVLSVAEYRRLTQRQSADAPNFIDRILGIPRDDGSFERGRV